MYFFLFFVLAESRFFVPWTVVDCRHSHGGWVVFALQSKMRDGLLLCFFFPVFALFNWGHVEGCVFFFFLLLLFCDTLCVVVVFVAAGKREKEKRESVCDVFVCVSTRQVRWRRKGGCPSAPKDKNGLCVYDM